MTHWLRSRAAAAHLNVSVSTLYRWALTHGMPCHPVGGINQYDRDEIDKWVRGHRRRQILTRHKFGDRRCG